jgi:hypothetical protein
MEVIKSPLILEPVIRENKFNIFYYLRGKVANLELYQVSPLQIQVLTDSANVGNYSMDVEMQKNNRIKILYAGLKQKKKLHTIYTRFGEPFQIRKDRFLISYNPLFNPNQDDDFEIRVDSILPLVYRKSAELQTTLINRMGSVFEMTYEDEMPRRTADFLNAVLNTYNNYTLEDKNKTTLNTIKFIEGRLDSLRFELNALERGVESFKRARGITEIEESSRVVLDQAKEAAETLSLPFHSLPACPN